MGNDDLVNGCYSCDRMSADDPPPREDIVRTDHWRVFHAFNSTLPGWLVLVPTRHLTSFTELTPEGAAQLGPLVRSIGVALEQVTGCVRTYLMQFSEAEGFSHLHLHQVPRMPDQPETARGPAVFTYLTDDRDRWVPTKEQDELALRLRAVL